MALKDIVLYPDSPLTEVCEPIESFDSELADLAADMFETMDTFVGIGLAGPQVGLAKRIFVMRDPETGEAKTFINPELGQPEGSVTAEEGCLSLPDVFAMVPRGVTVPVRGYDVHGNRMDFVAKDWMARVIQHETDHLNGEVFLDRLDILSRDDKMREWEQVRESMKAAARQRG